MRSPKDFFVTIDKKYIDEQGGLFIDTSFRPGWHSTVTGKIASCPPNSALGLKVGDEIAFSYLVVFSRTHTDNGSAIFYEDPSPSPFIQCWSNQKGQMLVRRYRKNDKWDIAFVVNGIIQDKAEGGEGVIESFMGKFDFESDTQFKYDNIVSYEGKDVWKVDPQLIYAKKEGEDIEMIKGHYLMRELAEVTEETESGLVLPFSERRKDMRAVVTHGEGIVKRGERVVTDRDRIAPYNFWGEDYLLAREDQILAKIV